MYHESRSPGKLPVCVARSSTTLFRSRSTAMRSRDQGACLGVVAPEREPYTNGVRSDNERSTFKPPTEPLPDYSGVVAK